VVESSNGANSVIFYGKCGHIATNRREAPGAMAPACE
jgi:TnpA family transposase